MGSRHIRPQSVNCHVRPKTYCTKGMFISAKKKKKPQVVLFVPLMTDNNISGGIPAVFLNQVSCFM